MRTSETPQYKLVAAFCEFAWRWKEMFNIQSKNGNMHEILCAFVNSWRRLQKFFDAYLAFYNEVWIIETKDPNGALMECSCVPRELQIRDELGGALLICRPYDSNYVDKANTDFCICIENIVSIKFGNSDKITFKEIEMTIYSLI